MKLFQPVFGTTGVNMWMTVC